MMGPTGTQNLFSERFCAIVLAFYFVSLGAYAAELFPHDSHTKILDMQDDAEHCFNISIPLFVSQQQYNFICVGVNGYISFTSGKLEAYFEKFPVDDHPVIAAILFDFVDEGISKILQAIVTAPSDTQLFTETIKLVDEDFQTDWAFIVTWEEIIMYGKQSRSTFQSVLVADLTRGKTYSIFNYQKVTLEQEFYAAGYNFGDGKTYKSLPGVDDNNFEAEVLLKSNVGIPGRYVIRVDGTAYGPSSVRLSPLGDLMALCPAETDTIDVYCEVDVDNVFPEASVVLRVPSIGDLQPTHKTHENDSVRNHFQVKPRTSGTVVLICVATNTLNSTIFAENQTQFTFHALQENYNPVLTIGDLPVSHNSTQLVGRQPHLVSCSINETVAGYVALSLECGNESSRSTYNVTSVIVELTPSNNQFRCVCHVSGCSEDTTQATLQLALPKHCDYGWTNNPDDNTCLRAIRGRRRTYARAVSYCQNLGGELAKNVFTYSQRRRITRLVKFRAHFFIGLDDADNNGFYTYKDGSAMEANPPFKKGSPPSGRCVTINNRRWFAKDCNKARFFVCEKDAKITS